LGRIGRWWMREGKREDRLGKEEKRRRLK